MFGTACVNLKVCAFFLHYLLVDCVRLAHIIEKSKFRLARLDASMQSPGVHFCCGSVVDVRWKGVRRRLWRWRQVRGGHGRWGSGKEQGWGAEWATLPRGVMVWISLTVTSVLLLHSTMKMTLTDSVEYCQFEHFNATCPPGHVILVEEARYGRLQLGRCVTRDYGYLGCSANVLDIVDRACSGRRWCLVGVAGMRDVVQPCHGDLTSYLEATYRCLETVDINSPACNTSLLLRDDVNDVDGRGVGVRNSDVGVNDVSGISGSGTSFGKGGRRSGGNDVERAPDSQDVPREKHGGEVIRSSDQQQLQQQQQQLQQQNHQQQTQQHLQQHQQQQPLQQPQQQQQQQQQRQQEEEEDDGRKRRPLKPTGSTVAYIASGHGWDEDMAAAAAFTSSCPLQISARPGQVINFTLYSFTTAGGAGALSPGTAFDQRRTYGSGGDYWGTDTPARALRFCSAHVFIAEGARSHGSPLCPWKQERERHLYISTGHTVFIHFSQQYRKVPASRKGTFILKVEAVGCANVPTSGEYWTERMRDRLVIRCNQSLEVFHLTCRNNRWTGQKVNCTTLTAAASGNKEKTATSTSRGFKIHFGLLLAVAVGVVLGILSGLVMLTLMFIHKQRSWRRRSSKTKCLLTTDDVAATLPDDNFYIHDDDDYRQKAVTSHDVSRGHRRTTWSTGASSPLEGHYSGVASPSTWSAASQRGRTHRGPRATPYMQMIELRRPTFACSVGGAEGDSSPPEQLATPSSPVKGLPSNDDDFNPGIPMVSCGDCTAGMSPQNFHTKDITAGTSPRGSKRTSRPIDDFTAGTFWRKSPAISIRDFTAGTFPRKPQTLDIKKVSVGTSWNTIKYCPAVVFDSHKHQESMEKECEDSDRSDTAVDIQNEEDQQQDGFNIRTFDLPNCGIKDERLRLFSPGAQARTFGSLGGCMNDPNYYCHEKDKSFSKNVVIKQRSRTSTLLNPPPDVVYVFPTGTQ